MGQPQNCLEVSIWNAAATFHVHIMASTTHIVNELRSGIRIYVILIAVLKCYHKGMYKTEKHARNIVACCLLALVMLTAQRVWGAIKLPPRLAGGERVQTINSQRLLEAPDSLAGVNVAREAPVVDFMYYPGQDYEGGPWSNWGDGTAVKGKYYSAIGDHKAPEGNAFVYEYDPASKTLRKIVELREILDVPDGEYTPGKIHSRIDMGSDGWLYFATHRGSTKVTTDEFGYKGDWILRHHPETGRTEVVAHGPVGRQCIPCSVLDPEKLIFYGGTAAGDYSDKRIKFFAYDINARQVLYSGYKGPGRYMMFSRSKNVVYFVPNLQGRVFKYDPTRHGSPVELDVEMGIRAATRETSDGFIYTVSKDGAMVCRFDVKREEVKILGPAAVGSQTYITSIDIGPGGRYLYYVPGAHGGSEKDGSAVVQFDTTDGTKKVVAFLHPVLREKFGYIPLGTFSTALSEGGEKLYITWNGNLGGRRRNRLTWDACALTVLHIPESERLP